MNNSDLGRVQAYLLRYCHAERSQPVVALTETSAKLQRCYAMRIHQSRALLEEIFDGQGLELKSFNEFEAAGIQVGATVFVLARKPDSNPPFWGTEKLIARMMRVRGGIDKDDAKIWFTQLWFCSA